MAEVSQQTALELEEDPQQLSMMSPMNQRKRVVAQHFLEFSEDLSFAIIEGGKSTSRFFFIIPGSI